MFPSFCKSQLLGEAIKLNVEYLSQWMILSSLHLRLEIYVACLRGNLEYFSKDIDVRNHFYALTGRNLHPEFKSWMEKYGL